MAQNGQKSSPGPREESPSVVEFGSPAVVPGKEAQLARDRAEALHLRTKGYTYREIGECLGVCEQTARRYYLWQLEYVRKVSEEIAEDHVTAECIRLDYLYSRLREGIEAGDEKSIAQGIKISESKRKLLGVDMPKKIAQTDADGNTLTQADVQDADPLALLERLSSLRARLREITGDTNPDPAIVDADFEELETPNP